MKAHRRRRRCHHPLLSICVRTAGPSEGNCIIVVNTLKAALLEFMLSKQMQVASNYVCLSVEWLTRSVDCSARSTKDAQKKYLNLSRIELPAPG